jgi:hypothetical protein
MAATHGGTFGFAPVRRQLNHRTPVHGWSTVA